MADPFASFGASLSGPYRNSAAVTPHNTTELDPLPRALWVGGVGDVVVKLADDTSTTTLTAVAAGTLLPLRPVLVKSTGTTATLIIALW